MNIITAINSDPVIALELIAIMLCAIHIIKEGFYQNSSEVCEDEQKVTLLRPHLVKI